MNHKLFFLPNPADDHWLAFGAAR